jgi:hypothetical protein
MNSDYFNQLFDELKQLCENYRVRYKYHFCEVKLREKYINILFWTIRKTKVPHLSSEGKKIRFAELVSTCKDFHKSHIHLQIEIMKNKLSE